MDGSLVSEGGRGRRCCWIGGSGSLGENVALMEAGVAESLYDFSNVSEVWKVPLLPVHVSL